MTTYNAFELWQQSRNGVPVLNADPTERWYRIAQPNADILYGWGTEIEADAWAWLLNDMADLVINVYSTTLVEDANMLARLDQYPGEGYLIVDCLHDLEG